ncbi:Helicase associated domain protein [Streptomyces sp. NPDC051976]|uniref:DEAD/DEAH box helicase n=1 Tax=Streptomyces sp. NPDC051976 TaxID=3154947 RepID=UPI0034197E3E
MATLTANGLRTPLRGHQEIAVDSCVTSFAQGTPRVTVTMATGTGKTLVGLNTVQETAPHGNALVVMPTLKLLEQTAAVWRREGRRGRYLGVCSLPAPEEPDLRSVLTMVHTPEHLAAEAASARADGPVNVFSTYASLKKIEAAHRDLHLPRWDVLISDEAHRSAGNLGKTWAIIHSNDALPAHHRLYMTATPRIFDHEAVSRGLRPAPECEIASMDDLSLYGPVVYRISLAEAIDQGLLADYEIVAVEITDEDLRRILNRHTTSTQTAEGLRVAAAQVALLRAQHRYDLRRTLTFHTFVAAATTFAETLHETAALMPATTQAPLQVCTVNSRQSPFERHRATENFVATPLHTQPTRTPPRRAVLTNCRCYTEGVDIPTIDSILFADPKTSSVEIVQAVGRALRQTPGDGKISRIIVPVYIAPGEDLGEGTKRTPFHLLYQVMIALSVYDEHVFHRVEYLRHDDDADRPHIAARPERADEIIPLLGLTHASPPNKVWEHGFESAERFHAEHGHLDVPSRHLGADRFYLGWWIGQQRSLRQNHMLLPERINALDTLGMTWEHPRHSIEYTLQVAREYTARHGHLAPRTDERHGGIHLGRWVAERRKEARERTLPFCYHRALNEIYPWWNARWHSSWNRAYTKALAAARKGDLAFPDLRPDGDDSPLTRWLDQQIDALPSLHPNQHNLLGALPLQHPLALLLRRPRGASEWAFARGLRAARTFWRAHQHLDVPFAYACRQDGPRFLLGRWIADKRRAPGALTREQLDALQALDMRWLPRPRSHGD